jgi:hypothetical protein
MAKSYWKKQSLKIIEMTLLVAVSTCFVISGEALAQKTQNIKTIGIFYILGWAVLLAALKLREFRKQARI